MKTKIYLLETLIPSYLKIWCIILLTFLVLKSNAQTPTLGNYPNVTVVAGKNTLATPTVVPTNTIRTVAYTNTNFTGTFAINPATGVVRVINAKPAGTYLITVKGFNGVAIATKTFTLTVTNPTCSPGTFNYSSNVMLGSNATEPLSPVIGDFNNDGLHDVLTAIRNTNEVNVSIGDGTGNFNSFGNHPVGAGPREVAIGDFNLDGNQDFATVNTNNDNVSIKLGDGLGNFSGTSTVSVGDYPVSIVIGDLNGDGIQDFATGNQNSVNVSIKLGDGMGGFSGSTLIAVGNNPRSITIGDFNNDFKQDLVVGGSTISVLLGDGLGGIDSMYSLPMICTYVTVCDLNRDGNQDIISSCLFSDLVSVLLGDGIGGFMINNVYNVQNPFFIRCGDFNGDGDEDIAIAGWDVHIWLGAGNGSFSNIATIPSIGTWVVAIGDFNGDSTQDFFTPISVSNYASIYLGTAVGGGNSEINIQVNSTNIIDGDITPSTTDNTDFGNLILGSCFVRTYTIQNTGITSLTVNGINFSGLDASSFALNGITFPVTIAANSSIGFSIAFSPLSIGLKVATVNILSDDCNEAVYDFVIQGTGTNAIGTPSFFNAVPNSINYSVPLNSSTNNKVQWIYAPNTFSTNGTTTGTSVTGSNYITKVFIHFGAPVNPSTIYSGFQLSLGQNGSVGNSFTAGSGVSFITGLTTVYSSNTFQFTGIVANGWYGITLSIPFLYDPSQSLFVELKTNLPILGGNWVNIIGTTGVYNHIHGSYSSTTGTGAIGLTPMGIDIISALNCSSPPTPGTATTSATSVCNGQAVTLGLHCNSIGLSQMYQWESSLTSNGVYSNASASSVLSSLIINPTTTNYYRCKVTCGTSTVVSTNVIVTVYPLPSVTATANPPTICAGQTSVITASGTSTYTIVPGGTFTVTPTATTTYTITGTGANGCTKTSTVTITVNPLPSVTATANPPTVCAGQTSVITASGASSYSIVPGGIFTVTPTATTTYTVTGTGANGCTKTSTVTITVNPIPTVTAIASPSTICPGQTSIITPSGNATSYSMVPNGLGTTTYTVTPNVTTTYTITGTSSNGCIKTTTVTVTLNFLLTLAQDQPISCHGQTDASLQANTNIAGTYTYTLISPNSTSQSNNTGYFDMLMPGTHTVTANNGACTQSQTITFIEPLPLDIVFTSDSLPTCNGQLGNLNAIITGGTSVLQGYLTWWVNSTNDTLNDILYDNFALSVDSLNAGVYHLNIEDDHGCFYTEYTTLNNLPLTVNATASVSTIYLGQSSIITPSGDAISYSILPGTTFTVTPSATTTYTITGASAGCSSTTTVTVTVIPGPVLGTYPNTTIIDGTNIKVTPSAVPINTLKTVAYTNTNFTGTLFVDTATGIVTVTNARPAGTYTVTVKAWNATDSLTTSFVLTVTDPICNAGTFTSKPLVSTGNYPNAFTIGDFNNDGNQDFAIANYNNSYLSIRLGNGDGTFSTSPPIVLIGGGGSQSIALADFNRDGKQDIAVVRDGVQKLVIRLGNGDGTFSNAIPDIIYPGYNLYNIVAGDFNNDGKADIAIATGGALKIIVCLGDGNAGFGTPYYISTYGSTSRLMIRDFNKDGIQDIITNNSNFFLPVQAYLGTGTGSFTPYNLGVELNRGTIYTVGDINDDDTLDVLAATSTPSSNQVNVTLGSASGMISKPSVTVGYGSHGIELADFNGDGKQDFANVDYNDHKVSIRFGDGTGLFTNGPSLIVGAEPVTLAVGDFNNDGINDFASASAYSGLTIWVGDNIKPEINVKGNNISIDDGDTTASISDHTDFASGTYTRTYTIENTGTGPLTIYNIHISGLDSSSFTISGITFPFTLPINNSVTFIVNFTPTSNGTKTAIVKIKSNDCDEGLYDFAIQGIGIMQTTLNLECFIESYWDQINGMVPVLANQGQPTTTGVCDTIKVQLHKAIFPYDSMYSCNTILNQDGTAICIFNPPVAIDSYYIAVKHRHAIQTWSSSPVAFNSTIINYNFTDSVNKAYGNNQIEVAPGVWAFYAGDINQDGNIDLLDLTELEVDISSFLFGYYTTDINGDGNVDLLDAPLVETNLNNFIFSSHP